MNKPKALKKGDTIGLIAPAGALKDPAAAEKAAGFVRNLGFGVKLGKSARGSRGYLAGTDAARARDVNDMFADSSVSGIFCLRGGSGAPRIAPLLDMDAVRRRPKVFVGYSDITALLIQFVQQANLTVFHGPMPAADMIVDGFDSRSLESLLSAVMDTSPRRELVNPGGKPVCLYPGKTTAPITGGNLTVISLLMGTPYEIDTRGKILLIEDIGEEPYRTDGRLCQLRSAGKLDECAGFIIGNFKDCQPSDPSRSLSMGQIIEDLILPARKPVLAGLNIGHCEPKLTIPFGVPATLDATNGRIYFEESFVI